MICNKRTLQLFYFAIIIVTCETARILAVFPTPAYSHQIVFRPITQELAKRGHHVTVMTPYPAFYKGNTPENLTEIDIYKISDYIRSNFFAQMTNAKNVATQQVVSMSAYGWIFEEQMKLEKVQRLLKDKKNTFDLILAEATVRPALVFSHIFKAPLVQISSFGGALGMLETVGAATHPMLYPSGAREMFQNLTFWDRIFEYFLHYWVMKKYYEIEERENQLLKKMFGPDTPLLVELKKNIAIALLNVHPLWDFNRPVPLNVIYLGGLCKTPQGSLPEDIQSFLDEGKNGVIYISFGTNVHTGVLGREKIVMMIETFTKLPYKFLLKYDDENVIGSAKNVKTFKWSSQTDILMHANVKLFITQGGLQSTYESIAAGVPLIGIPLMWEQFLNVDKFVQFDIGIHLDIDTLNENVLKSAIEEVIGNERYKRNTMKLRSLMNDLTGSPVERAVWWTEHVLRHDTAAHMRTAAANMNWFEYYEIELLFYMFLMLLVLILWSAVNVMFILRIIKWKL